MNAAFDSVTQTEAPRLKMTNNEELAKYVDRLPLGPLAFRTWDSTKTSLHSFNGTQESWRLMWKCLKHCPSSNTPERRRLLHDLKENYDQTTIKLSHDVPLVQDKMSRLQSYDLMRAHSEALRP